MVDKTMGTLIDLLTIEHEDIDTLENFGIEIGKLYTNHGLPLDISLSRLEYCKEFKLIILHGACEWFLQHKRDSGATEKAIERQIATNEKIMDDFVKTGEVGIY